MEGVKIKMLRYVTVVVVNGLGVSQCQNVSLLIVCYVYKWFVKLNVKPFGRCSKVLEQIKA